MPYTHFRFIAYEVPTATERTDLQPRPVVSGFPPGGICPQVQGIVYPNVSAGPPPDWYVRLARLAWVIDLARRSLTVDNQATLKVFVAPEFYFRPRSPQTSNTYPAFEAWALKTALTAMFMDSRFNDWLIIAGSVMWHRIIPVDPTGRYLPIFYNTVFYVRGGPQPRPVGLIEKHLPSTIDGIPCEYAPGRYPPTKLIHHGYEVMRERIFLVDGIPVGIEICRDHVNERPFRVLRRVFHSRNLRILGDPVSPPALHVLTAGGMPKQIGSVTTCAGGYLLRTDGFSDPPRSELCHVRGYQYADGRPATIWDDGAVAQLLPNFPEQQEIAIPPGASTVPPMPEAGTYLPYEQKLRIYDQFPLPAGGA